MPINFPIDLRNYTERDVDAHFEEFRDGYPCDKGKCEKCDYWREQEARDLEKV